MASETHIDFLELLKTTKKRLTEKNPAGLVKLDSASLSDLLSGKEMLYLESVKPYFSPVLILDKETQAAYPLFYLTAKTRKSQDKVYLSKTEDLPVFNSLAVSFLSKAGLEMNDFTRINDLSSYLLSLDSSLEVAKLETKIGLVYALSFADEKTLSYNALVPLLSAYVSNMDLGTRFQGVLSDIRDPKEEKAIDGELKKGYFTEEYRALRRLEHYQSARVTYAEEELRDDFLIRSLKALLPKSENILLVVPDQEKEEELLAFLKKRDLGGFTRCFSAIDPKALPPLSTSTTDSDLSTEEKKRLWNLRENEQKYLALGKKRRKCITYPSVTVDPEEVKEVFAALESDAQHAELDLSDYSTEDYDHDLRFLETFDSYPSIQASHLSDHLCFGLSVSGKRENYDSLQVLLIKGINQVRDFQSSIEEAKLTDLAGTPITSFAAFEKLGKDMAVLAGYNGFPRKYFKIPTEADTQHSLSDLKAHYQAVSSAHLLIDNLCGETIYSADIASLLKDYHGKKFFLHRKAKKTLISYLKIKKHPDVKTLARILESYLHSTEELQKILPDYVEAYGDSVTTMNGVAEIESNINYLAQFRSRTRMNPDFNIENPIIKRALKERAYRLDLISLYQKLDQKYAEIKKTVNAYIGYFLDDPKPYLKMSFTDLLSLFAQKQKASYEEFSEYASFTEASSKTSMLLQLTLRHYQLNQEKLTDFRNEYLLSLFRTAYYSGRSAFEELERPFNEARLRYEASLFGVNDLLFRFFSDRIAKLIISSERTGQFSDSYQRTKLALKNHAFGYPERKASYALDATVYPLFIATPEDLGLIPEGIFDNVFIFCSSALSLDALLNSMRLGRKVLFFTEAAETDARIQGVPETYLSRETLYRHPFDFKRFPSSLLTRMQEEAKKQGYSLIEGNPLFPLCLTKEGADHPTVALLPDILIPEGLTRETETELREYLLLHFQVLLVIMDTFGFAFDPEGTMRMVLSEEGKAIEKSQSKEMTFLAAERLFSDQSPEEIYRQEINKIKSSFKPCLSGEQFLALVAQGKYEEAFQGAEPIKVSLLDSIEDPGFRDWLSEERDEAEVIIEKDGFYRDISFSRITFKTSDKSIRTMEEISEEELMQGMKAFIYSFDFFEEEELRSILATLVDYDTDDPEFSLRFDDAVETMIEQGLISRNGDRLALRLD
jgi:hypothetical protein